MVDLLKLCVLLGFVIVPIGAFYLDPLLFGEGSYWIASTVEYGMFLIGVAIAKFYYQK